MRSFHTSKPSNDVTPKQSYVVVLLMIVFTLGLGSEIFAQQKDSVSTAPRISSPADLGVRSVENLIDRYFDSLNEPDDKRRRELTNDVWTEHGKFGTPYGEVQGRDQINKLVAGVQSQFPNAVVRRTSKIDGFGKYLRWSFTLSDAAGKPILSGVDFAILLDGKLETVMGFFDFAPARPQ